MSSKYIKHFQYGCYIEGDVPGPYEVTRDGQPLGTAEDMREAVMMAKRACNESASVFDVTPYGTPRAEN